MKQRICNEVDDLSGSVCNQVLGHKSRHKDDTDGVEINWPDSPIYALAADADSSETNDDYMAAWMQFYAGTDSNVDA